MKIISLRGNEHEFVARVCLFVLDVDLWSLPFRAEKKISSLHARQGFAIIFIQFCLYFIFRLIIFSFKQRKFINTSLNVFCLLWVFSFTNPFVWTKMNETERFWRLFLIWIRGFPQYLSIGLLIFLRVIFKKLNFLHTYNNNWIIWRLYEKSTQGRSTNVYTYLLTNHHSVSGSFRQRG